MGRPRTYGARKTHASIAASALFSSISRKNHHPKLPTSPERSALTDITSAVSNLNLDGDTENEENRVGHNHDDDDDDESSDTLADSESEESPEGLISQVDEDHEPGEEDEASILDAKHKHLLPLVTTYSIDTGRTMTTHSWADLLPPDCTVIKIAEASYAEVYRITIPSGETSIIKVMRIQSPSDPASSTSDTAIRVENIVSEVRIMNTLTELPGFVRFKDAHIILGRSVPAFIDAYERREEVCKGDRASQFPHPELYTDASEFLAIELGDAGCVLEDFAVTSIEQVWDILLGTILALAKGEMANEFEHRDLHENNICVSVSPAPSLETTGTSATPNLKLGRAGVKTTLIDYGLSRAKLQNGTVVFLDLEEDPMVFQGSEGHPQFNAYRRTKIQNGAFGTATETLCYCVERGWVSEVQAEEYGADVSGVF
ncbi:putative serine/threonine-protein kinase haspin-like [Lachnellula arida]|uniref:Putative serine/threonine-protein kinase haspin-like n=1 Tax=Lachnellula arida TaxID=1316785 RepID=A0A8T9BK35_9HELO|nr:putative serine/threonine-protein kinase haspin-like [Lachnellula arida]